MERLRELRKERHLTQRQLGDILDISASTIGMYEQGRSNPEVATLKKIADYFGVTTDYLIRDTLSEDAQRAIQWFKNWQSDKEELGIRSSVSYKDTQELDFLSHNADNGKAMFEKFYSKLSSKEKKEVDELLDRLVSLDAEEALLIQYYRGLDERGKRTVTDALMREHLYIHTQYINQKRLESLSKKNNSAD